MRTVVRAILLGSAASLLLASTAFASHCVNASKQPGAGAGVVIDIVTGDVTWMRTGVVQRLEAGLIDPVTGEGYRGLVGFDLDGDGDPDASTWIGVGPDGLLIPIQALLNGPACRGVTDLDTFFAECLGS